MDRHSLVKALQQSFGYDNFRGEQLSIIISILKKNDTLALLPTGGGKSLCYQFPIVFAKWKAIVISPLIALMEDQLRSALQWNIPANAIHSGVSKQDNTSAWNDFLCIEYGILFLSPEKALSFYHIGLWQKANIDLLVIDEAHCISQWGHDFRPNYLELSVLRNSLPEVVTLALTATATHHVCEDLINYLHFRKYHVYRQSFFRDNLKIKIRKTNSVWKNLLDLIKKHNCSTIIYLRNRMGTELLALKLKKNNIEALPYHGGMSYDKRKSNARSWLINETQVMVATNAFGMGIDKGDVGLVVHLDLPGSIEEYYQEIGRAGRDGKESDAIYLISDSDIQKSKRTQQRYLVHPEDISQLTGFLIGQRNHQQKVTLSMRVMKKELAMHPLKVMNGLKLLERSGYLWCSDGLLQPSTIRLFPEKVKAINKNNYLGFGPELLRYLVKKYENLFDKEVIIEEEELATDLGLGKYQIIRELQKLGDKGFLNYQKKVDEGYVELQNFVDLEKNIERVLNYQSHKMDLFNQMLHMISSDHCRQVEILNYFGEEGKPCGKCDNCAKKKKSRNHNIKAFYAYLEKVMNADTEVSIESLRQNSYLPEVKTLAFLQYLANERRIKIHNGKVSKIR